MYLLGPRIEFSYLEYIAIVQNGGFGKNCTAPKIPKMYKVKLRQLTLDYLLQTSSCCTEAFVSNLGSSFTSSRVFDVAQHYTGTSGKDIHRKLKRDRKAIVSLTLSQNGCSGGRPNWRLRVGMKGKCCSTRAMSAN